MAQEVDLGARETMEALDPSEFLAIKIKSQSVLSVEKAKSHPELSGAGGGNSESSKTRRRNTQPAPNAGKLASYA